MQQPGFNFGRDEFDVPVPAATSSVSSVRAAERLKGCRGEQMGKLLTAYASVGLPGMNSAQVHSHSGLRISSICSLRAAAVEKGWLVKLAETRVASDSGFQQDVHRITSQGQQALAEWKARR